MSISEWHISGVACILNEGGVSLVLRAMRLYAAVAEVGSPNPNPNPNPNPKP